MKKLMKVLSVLLTVCVLFAALPLTVHAEPTAYDLWVGDTQVNAANCSDIPSVTEGHASFDPETNTLTLNDVRKVYSQTLKSVIYSKLDHLNIRLIDKNSFDYYYFDGNNYYERSRGIFTTGSLTFTDGGWGSLGFYGLESPVISRKAVTVEDDAYLYINMNGPQMGRTMPPTAVDCGSLTVSGGEIEIDGLYRSINATSMQLIGDWHAGTYYSHADGIMSDSFTMTGGAVKIVNANNGITARQMITVSGGKLDISSDDSCVYSFNDIDISGLHTRAELNSNNIAMYASRKLDLSDELSIVSPEGGSIGTWYGYPAIVDADGSGAANVLLETAQNKVVDNVWLTMTMPKAGDSRSDIEATVTAAPEDEGLYYISSLSFGEILEDGVDWGVEAFESGKTYILDVCVNTCDGHTLLGGGTNDPPAYDDRFHAYVNDVEITHEAPATYPTNASWLHYRFTVAKKYNITVNGGKAYDTVEFTSAEPVTAIAAETPAIIIADPVPGKSVAYWIAEPSVDFIINEKYLAGFLMPDHDVTLTPIYFDQSPIVYNISKGETDINTTVQSVLAMMYVPGFESFESGEEVKIDLDGDGTDDIGTVWTWDSEAQKDSAVVYALDGTNLTGIYSFTEPNISPFSPIRFIFPSNKDTVTLYIDLGGFDDDITLEVPYGARLNDVLFEEGVYEKVESIENEDYICRGDFTTKPFSEFADEEEFYEDNNSVWLGYADSDLILYACFLERIKTVELTLKRPEAGTVVTVDENYVQTPAPEIVIAPGQHCYIPGEVTDYIWTKEMYGYEPFEGTFIEGESYYTSCYITPDFRYYIGNETTVIAHGATVEESYGEMGLSVTLSAKAIGPALLGDADGDGDVTVVDATVIQRFLADMEVPPFFNKRAADVDCDNDISTVDATFIQRWQADMPAPEGIGKPIA